jgi:hypothetical protein
MKQQQLPRSRRSLELFASSPGGLQREGMQLHTSTWLAVRLVWPFAAAAFIPPLVTAAILPLILSPQVRQVRLTSRETPCGAVSGLCATHCPAHTHTRCSHTQPLHLHSRPCWAAGRFSSQCWQRSSAT